VFNAILELMILLFNALARIANLPQSNRVLVFEERPTHLPSPSSLGFTCLCLWLQTTEKAVSMPSIRFDQRRDQLVARVNRFVLPRVRGGDNVFVKYLLNSFCKLIRYALNLCR